MVREKMQIDGPLIAVPNGDSQKRLRSKRNMVRLEFLIRREQQTVHLPHIADAVFLLVLGQREQHLARRQLGLERLPCEVPLRDARSHFEIKRFRRHLTPRRRNADSKRPAPSRDLHPAYPDIELSGLLNRDRLRCDRIPRSIRAPHRLRTRRPSHLVCTNRLPPVG